MKIFISHSSKDKWAARRISNDLIEKGAETFLDEKDIKTGDPIDSSIKKNLKDCDQLLILLSPASVKSDWVLIELGGAIALEKKIIPILLYVGANEIPQVLNLKLARDINTIDSYYIEVENELKGIPTVEKDEKLKVIQFKNAINVGDFVKISDKRPIDVYRNDVLIDWEEPMDQYLGQATKVATISEDFEDTYGLEIDDEYYVWAKEWLTILKID